MTRRRSLLSTKDKKKVENLFNALPRQIIVKGKQLDKTFIIKWEKIGKTEFEGSRFIFIIESI